MSAEALPAPETEREIAVYQTGYHFGVAEGVRIGREQIATEQLAQQAAHATAHPFPADDKIKSLRAKQARQEARDLRKAA